MQAVACWGRNDKPDERVVLRFVNNGHRIHCDSFVRRPMLISSGLPYPSAGTKDLAVACPSRVEGVVSSHVSHEPLGPPAQFLTMRSGSASS